MAVERRAAEERVVGQLLVERTLVERFANKKNSIRKSNSIKDTNKNQNLINLKLNDWELKTCGKVHIHIVCWFFCFSSLANYGTLTELDLMHWTQHVKLNEDVT